MARKYSPSASKDVKRAMTKRKSGTLKSGTGGRGGAVTSRKQAIAIGLSEARAKGKKVPSKKKAAKKAVKKAVKKAARKTVKKVAKKAVKKVAKKAAGKTAKKKAAKKKTARRKSART